MLKIKKNLASLLHFEALSHTSADLKYFIEIESLFRSALSVRGM